MINKVQIKNFQSHRNTNLEFVSPGVNVIVGPTDAGKSSIFRAIVWGLFNRPLGEGFRSHWSGKESTEVTIEFDDKIISRIKGNNINEYRLNNTILKAFGQDPPEEILQAHKVDRTLNVQSQIDPFFLIQSSAGEVATYLNQVAGLDDIDRVSKGLQSHLRNVQRDVTTQSNMRDNLKSQLQQYEGLEQIGIEIERVENLEHDLGIIREKYIRLNKTTEDINHIQHRLDAGSKQLDQAAPELVIAERNQSEIEKIKEISVKLRRTLNLIKQRQYNIARSRERLTTLEDEWHEKMPEGSECPLCGSIILGIDTKT